MFDDFYVKFIRFLKSRLTFLSVLFLFLTVLLIYRLFTLQIVNGEKYLDEFMLKNVKTRDISGTRGKIYDRNGNLLAYNELAYSVKLEDVYETNRQKNKNLNATIYKLICMIEKNGDHVISDFKVILDEDGYFTYSVEGTKLLRFLADVYGKKTIDELEEEEKTVTAENLMEHISRKNGFAIGEYENPEDSSSAFIPGKGYTKEEWLKMVNIRYAMNLTSYRKYIGTTIATNVSEKTVAVIMENAYDLPGVTIEEDTIRKYIDSKYFAHVLGYTGNISADELTELNQKKLEETGLESFYSINDIVGKSGIEGYMETTLQGTKGSEKVVVDNTGKVISLLEHIDATSGSDVYLTIDKDLTMIAYNIIEQKLAGLLLDKIINTKEYIPGENSQSADIKIPIYDVYFALFNNNVIDLKHMSSKEAGETESLVYAEYLEYKDRVYESLKEELFTKKTVYSKLNKEFQIYESNMVSILNKQGIIMTGKIPENDSTYIRWTKDEVISLTEYLEYCISMNWIDVTKLELEDVYSDSKQVFDSIMKQLFILLDNNSEFQKKIIKYALLNNAISGKEVAMVLCEQGLVDIPIEDELNLMKGKLSPYDFMKNRIRNLEITPAMLALDPCNASTVITDVNSGDILALVTYPGYDNNKMANSIDPEYYAKLNSDKSNPQYNFATQYKAAPGSTFKMVSSAAGLMEGVISLSTKVFCQGTYTNITPNARCWKIYGHGTETVETAIRDSCNYFFYDIGYNLSLRNGEYVPENGLNTLYQYADMFGLSEKSGVEISEAAPNVSDIDPVRSAIGQGSNSFTTVSLARYISTVANGGICYNLTLLDKVTDSEGILLKNYEPNVRNTVYLEPEYWDVIHRGMKAVVDNKSYFRELGIELAGKTGTAEQSKSRPNHALFVCYAPYDTPEIAIATRIPFGYSSDYAAQCTKEILKYYYHLEETDALITGTADTPDAGITNEM